MFCCKKNGGARVEPAPPFAPTEVRVATGADARDLSSERELTQRSLMGMDLTLHNGTPSAFGDVTFGDATSAKFLCLSCDTAPEKVYKVLRQTWGLASPSALLSVTGSAQDWQLAPHLEKIFKRGLVSAARSTDAWSAAAAAWRC